MSSYDISHPSDLVGKLRAFPESFLTLDPRVRLVNRQSGGERYSMAVKQYQLINPGEFEKGTYFCLSVDEKAVANLEDNNELMPIRGKDRHWRLKNRV